MASITTTTTSSSFLLLGDVKRFMWQRPAASGVGSVTVGQSVLPNSTLAQIFSSLSTITNATTTNDVNSNINEVINQIQIYYKLHAAFNSEPNMDTIAFLLASCAALAGSNETLLHKIYETLTDTSPTPVYLFAFEYYLNYAHSSLQSSGGASEDTTTNKTTRKHMGRGHKRALAKWYNEKYDEPELLSMLTKYKSGYGWSNKDLFKLTHFKPQTKGLELIVKYVLFGFEKASQIVGGGVKDTEVKLIELMADLERLKKLDDAKEAASIIRKYSLSRQHVPSKLLCHDDVVLALVEQLSLREFCEQLNKMLRNKPPRLIERSESHLINKLFNAENPEIKNISSIYLCLALQTYDQMVNGDDDGAESLADKFKRVVSLDKKSVQVRSALFDAFMLSAQHGSTRSLFFARSSRILLVTEVNSQMSVARSYGGLAHLKPLQISACILLNVYYLNKMRNVNVLMASDQVTELELADQNNKSRPDLTTIEEIFQQLDNVDPAGSVSTDKVFEWCMENKKLYDAIIVMSSSDQSHSQIRLKMDSYRSHAELPNSKLVLINFTGTKFSPTPTEQDTDQKLCLNLTGWNYDSFLYMDSFLSEQV